VNSVTLDHRRINLSADSLYQIEEALNTPSFLGFSVGPTINDALISALYNGERVWSVPIKMIDQLRYYNQRYQPPRASSKDFSKYVDRVVFTWLYDRLDLKELIAPIMRQYRADECILIASLPSMREGLSDQSGFILWDEFPEINMRSWRAEFDRCEPTWRSRLNAVLKCHQIPQFVTTFIMSVLQRQTQRIMAAELFLNNVKPRAIVTEYDRNSSASCLIIAAKKRGIPSVSMIHGALKPHPSYGFSPILANYICCWGIHHKNNLLQHGVSPDQLPITGCQSVSRTAGISQAETRLKFGVPVERRVVLLATNPLEWEERRKYTLAFCNAVSRLPEISAIVRLHPAEDILEYREIIAAFPEVIFLPNKKMTRNESIAIADIIVNHESSFGNDAILRGKLVVILDVLSSPLEVGKELVDFGGCPSAKSPEELASIIHLILVNKDLRSELHKRAHQYALQLCASYQHDATMNVCEVINRAISNAKMRIA
jgi:hypothetical protein